MTSLNEKKCQPCEGKVNAYSRQEAQRFLKEVPGWVLNESATTISREWIVRNFKEAINFIGLVAVQAENENHHPDIHLMSYRVVRIELSTHAIKGLSENDFILAAKINLLPVEFRQVEVKKNIISYLFTTLNVEPTKREITGLSVKYTWEQELMPDGELNVIAKTNWFYPLIIIVLVLGIGWFIKENIDTDLVLRKKVSFVKTKGGEFALKVSITARAKRDLRRIRIIDHVPHLVQLYDKFGTVHPDRVDMKSRRLEWDVPALDRGVERVFSYIVYSKIGVVGRFELPSAKAIYELEGRNKEVMSNKSFYVNELARPIPPKN